MSGPSARIAAALLSWIPQWGWAESAQNPGYVPPPPVISTASMLQLSAGLLVVLAFIALIAWLFKKIGFHPAQRNGLLKVVSAISVGQREKIVITEIGDTWLVLGVTPNQINLLYQVDKKSLPAGEAASPSPASRFTEKLQAHLEQDHEQH